MPEPTVAAPPARRGRPPADLAHRAATRLAVSRVAVRLFREHGLADTSGEQIAAAAGISTRTLWRYFRTKESCVEPLLRLTVDAYVAALRGWPRNRGLAEHLRAAYRLPPQAEPEDATLVREAIRMATTDPALRAIWLLVHDGAEPVLGAVLAERYGTNKDTLEVRVQAAAINAAQRLSIEEVAASPEPMEALRAHRDHLAQAVGAVVQGVGTPPRGVVR